jgi:transcriptional regulator with XRE-family HTH domain
MSSILKPNLAAALKSKRDAEGLSLRALSALIGISFSTLARIERGDGDPDNNSALRILNWLGEEAGDYGLALEEVAYVHFRAKKNISSDTVGKLLQVAAQVQKNLSHEFSPSRRDPNSSTNIVPELNIGLSKPEMEELAENFRADLGLDTDDKLDSLRLNIEGVQVHTPNTLDFIDAKIRTYLSHEGSDDWSAMSIPLNEDTGHWVVLRNESHTPERQRVTFLEEIWHIVLGHNLTKVAKIGGAYGRTYDPTDEHDAFYLAAASLLPKAGVEKCMADGMDSKAIALKYGTSPELVDYRIKRLGMWKRHIKKGISLG